LRARLRRRGSAAAAAASCASRTPAGGGDPGAVRLPRVDPAPRAAGARLGPTPTRCSSTRSWAPSRPSLSGRLVDVGCGNGLLQRHLASRG
jgi:2-polyprenyl-3-methyl-5-hydroxy-6-metoxy-1,4-benzoquinol methylase